MTQTVYLAITYLMIVSGFYATMQSFERNKGKTRQGVLFLMGVILLDLAVMGLRTRSPFFDNMAVGWCYFLPLFLLCKGSWVAKLFISASQHLLLSLMFVFSSFLGELFFPYQSTGQLILTAAFSCLLFFGWVFLCRRYARRLSDRLFIFTQPAMWAIYILIPIVSAFVMGLSLFSTGLVWSPNAFRSPMEHIALPAMVLLCYVLLFSTIVSTHDKALAQREIDLAHTTISKAHSQYDQLRALVEDVRRQRHDHRFHMMTIKQLLRQGNLEEALRYADVAENQITGTALPEYCLNPVINATICAIAEQCLIKGIAFDARVSLPQKRCPDEYELCAVLGNVLENAFIAAAGTPEGRKSYITLKMEERGSLFGIVCENSFDGHIVSENGRLLSTKKGPDQSGIGIASIKAIVKRYDGNFIADYNGETFTAYAVFKDY